MKPISLVLFAAMAAIATVTAQDGISAARILGPVPDGTPSPSLAPDPEYLVDPRDVLDSRTHQQGGRTITIRQIKPIALQLPAPVDSTAVEEASEFSWPLAESREEHPGSRLLFLGATVFRAEDSPPRTLVRYRPEEGREEITLWSSADFALIAGGIHAFVDSADETHQLVMSSGDVELERMTDHQSAKGGDPAAPDMPAFPAGKATFRMVGQQPAPEDIAIIQSLHDIYNSEYARLKAAHQGREEARIKNEEYLRDHPPEPKDITLNFWRIEKSAVNRKGADQ